MALSNTLLANLLSDIADILFLNKHEDKFDGNPRRNEMSGTVAHVQVSPPNSPAVLENIAQQ